MSILIFIVTIIGMVMVHEWGHFSVARCFNVAISAFSIGFGRPLIRWVSSRTHVEYRLCPMLLGGYVKFAEDLQYHPGQQLFDNLSLWKKISILLAGPLANLVLAFGALVIFLKMETYSILPYIGKVQPSSIAQQIGLKEGQRIQKINGKSVFSWPEVFDVVHQRKELKIEVLDSANELRRLSLSSDLFKPSSNLFQILGFEPHLPKVPAYIAKVQSGSPAEKSELMVGDEIKTINGLAIKDMDQLSEWVIAHPDTKIRMTLLRHGQIKKVSLTLGHWTSGGKRLGQLGIQTLDFSHYPEWYHIVHRSWADAFSLAVSSFYQFCKIQFNVWLHLKEHLPDLSGPVGMAKAADHAWMSGLKTYLFFIIWINIGLAIINLLPIPILDGGQCIVLVLNKFFPRFLGRERQNIIMLWSIIFIGGLFILGLVNDLSF